jgi:hypothetical protein
MKIDINVGEGIDWKFGLITRYVERISFNKYQIHDTSSGWYTATVDKETLDNLTTGKMSLIEIDWE